MLPIALSTVWMALACIAGPEPAEPTPPAAEPAAPAAEPAAPPVADAPMAPPETPAVPSQDHWKERPGFGQGTPVRFEVLDADLQRGVAALKLVYQHGDNDSGLVDCSYAGIPEGQGVELAFQDLSTGAMTLYDIYPRAYEPEQCLPHAMSEERLGLAKKQFADAGLDITKKPALIEAVDGAFDIDGTRFTTDDRRITDVTDKAFIALLGEQPEGEASMDAVAEGRVLRDGAPVWTGSATFSLVGAGSLSIRFPYALVQDGRVVFVEEDASSSMRGGPDHTWRLTAPQDL